MEVNRVQDLYPYRPVGNVGRQAPSESIQSGHEGSAEGDVVKISPEASFRAKLDGVAKNYATAARSNEAGQQARVESLKEKYQGDNCPVSGYDVATALMNTIFNGRE